MGMIIVDNQFAYIALAMINQSLKEICISTFKIERNPKPKGRLMEQLFKALLEKKQSGVSVKLLFNWHDDKKSIARTNEYVGRLFKGHNIEVRHLKGNRCCHAKLFIADNKKAIIGSHNLSCRSLSSNFEMSYLITDPSDVSQLKSVFQRSWYDAAQF